MEFKELNKENFEELCKCACQTNEILACFDISKQELENWCKKTYSKSFSEMYAYFKNKANEWLTEKLIELAKKGNREAKELLFLKSMKN